MAGKIIRKLRAIMSADVKGYSVLMADDEVSTIQTLNDYRNIMSTYIEQNDGRVVDAVGDNLLAEFESAVDAVQCAIEIQRELKRKNDELAKNRRMYFRIGIHIGDVVEEKERIYGDGVNIAARIEGLADPGSICISRNVHYHIKNKLNVGYEYLGEHSVKNISEPVRAYRVLMAPDDAGKLIGEKKKPSKMKWIGGATALIATILFIIMWQLYDKKPMVIKEEAVQQPVPVSSEKPTIAVLPFDNLSDDPEQEYFSDGMADDIITDLSKISSLMVISRNSTFAYKGKEFKIPAVAKELGVRYILEGSVRRAGDQVRINAQLIDAKTDHHVWADRFDGVNEDIFSLQDKVTEKIVSALALKLSTSEAHIIESKGTGSIIAHDLYLKGNAHLRRWTPDDLVKAINHFKQAVVVDSHYSQAYVGLARAYHKNIVGGQAFQEKTGQDLVGSRYLMRHYLELAMKNPTPGAYSMLGTLEMFRRHYRESIDLGEKAVALAPNDADALLTFGYILIYADKPKEAIQYIKKSMRLNPLEGNFRLGLAYMSMQKYEKALESAEHSLAINPKLLHAHLVSAVSYAHLGREDEAKEAFHNYLTIYGGGYPEMQFIYFNYPFKNPEVFHRFVEGLIKAGFQKDPKGYYVVDAANKLNGQEIKELGFGKTFTGYFFGYEWFFYCSEEGAAEFVPYFMGISHSGKAWIEGYTVCNQYEYLYEGVKFCFDVYYNTKGNAIEKSQYLFLGDAGLLPFSVLSQKPEWFKDLVKDTDIRQ